MLNIVVEQITAALELRSALPRQRYLARLEEALQRAPRQRLGCSNLAHVLAAQPDATRLIIKQGGAANIAIVSSYNEMLSAHAPGDVSALRDTIIAFFEAAMVEDVLVLPYAKQGLLGDVYESARVLSEDYNESGRVLKVRGLPGAIARLRRSLAAP